MSKPKARVIAFYLPQFHPIPENDRHWGKGFTEWTNVAKAKPLFRGHNQPRIPADLGFYDLRLEQVRVQQAELAREAGVEGFCYWHYWFGDGKEVLEMPFNDVVKTGRPDYPFCLGWANHDWTTKSWNQGRTLSKDIDIFKQKYPGSEDHVKHFYRLLPAFQDKRYITVDGKKLFVIFDGASIPNVQEFMNLWNDLATKNALVGFHFVAMAYSIPKIRELSLNKIDDLVKVTLEEYRKLGFDALQSVNFKYAELKSKGIIHKYIYAMLRRITVTNIIEKYKYSKIVENYYTPSDCDEDIYPQLLVGWDRSPRSGKKAVIYHDNRPEYFKKAALNALKTISKKEEEHKIIFLNSWNEWGEGAFMEPDLKYGKGMIDALKSVLVE